MTPADPLDPALDAALDRVAAAPRLLVALDFDGTLAPEVDDPLSARALPEAADALTPATGEDEAKSTRPLPEASGAG